MTFHPEHPTPVATATQSQSPVQPLLLDELLLDELLLEDDELPQPAPEQSAPSVHVFPTPAQSAAVVTLQSNGGSIPAQQRPIGGLLLDDELLDDELLDDELLDDELLEDELLEDEEEPPQSTTDMTHWVSSVAGQLDGTIQFSVSSQAEFITKEPEPLQIPFCR